MQAPVVYTNSGSHTNPRQTITDASGRVIAFAVGITEYEALANAREIVNAINRDALGDVIGSPSSNQSLIARALSLAFTLLCIERESQVKSGITSPARDEAYPEVLDVVRLALEEVGGACPGYLVAEVANA